MIFLTSINPRNNDLANICSWAEIGKVYSINTSDEIKALQPNYPNVEFVCEEFSKDNVKIYGRPYVNISTFFKLGKSSLIVPEDNCVCIINSDIRIVYSKILFDEIQQRVATDNSFVFAKRFNYKNDLSDAVLEPWGIDAFFMNKQLLEVLPQHTGFCMGLPGWDYWLPWLANRFGAKTFKVETPNFFHKTHALNWSGAQHDQMRKVFMDENPVDKNCFGAKMHESICSKAMLIEPKDIKEEIKIEAVVSTPPAPEQFTKRKWNQK